ncbi:hypothetical protein IWZ03DRAFT_381666 [Phyllosticta citriasiana]|uniref:Uncharacterized protein n=1 Tax=Phyllosticta citriasiana TaxID=595635 RepID=A0ABR1KH80_9PEZI
MQCRRFDALKGREAFPDIHLCLIVCFVVCLRISMKSREAHGCLFFFFFLFFFPLSFPLAYALYGPCIFMGEGIFTRVGDGYLDLMRKV